MDEKHAITETPAPVETETQIKPNISETSDPQNYDTVWRRVGYLSLGVLGLSLLIVLASVGFFCFLWYSNAENTIWHKIMINEWATRAISLTSTALRWAVATQAALGLAMLAAVALEGYDVPLAHTADVSLMRVNGGQLVPTLVDVCWPLSRFGPPGVILRTVLPILALLGTSTLVQFTSTALLSDLRTDVLPGYPVHSNLSIDWWFDGTFFRWTPTTAEVMWGGNKPDFWPAFAELSGPPLVQEGVSDTGKNVRAFLPFATVESRQNVRSYDGKAVLVDTRVTCQRPVLDDLIMYTLSSEGEWDMIFQPVLKGTVAPTVDTPRFNASDRPTPFDCPFSRLNRRSFAICELSNIKTRTPASMQQVYAGSLVSEFRSFPPLSPMQNASGAAYLIIAVNNTDLPVGNGEWASFEVVSPGDGRNTTYERTSVVSATVCYSALDTVIRDVTISSTMNRTEPTLSWNETTKNFDWTSVYKQLLSGYKSNLTVEERGILNLESKADTLVTPESLEPGTDGPVSSTITGSIYQTQWPYILEAVHLSYPGRGYAYGNYSVTLDEKFWAWHLQYGSWPQVGAATWVRTLFEHLVYGNDTVADALHMILFTLAGTAYYDQLPQYNNWKEVDTVSFVPALHPGGPFGTTRTEIPTGLTVTLAVIAFHVVVFLYVFWLFAYKTGFSRLGDTWMAIANVVDATLTDGMLETARQVRAGRKKVATAAPLVGEAGGIMNLNVGLKTVDGQVRLVLGKEGGQ
ncbi:Mitochondrial outer membrane protein iml2 [Orbilia oligospora]|uniref:Mitochondrial outer membrane protein iml2 n=1 Tax=Orbilia oligospora TaxID=2813651 RepID=A0A7C8NNR4_ORBOL|nr:Mitochondrial outer membrane protein iml2 [Orbilia oligospora]KAF3135932.1 Mitochondrial outer membrane protein iml2 [Orbilia oligospora]